ncbi:hypothetical protein [Xanthobacter sediminis]
MPDRTFARETRTAEAKTEAARREQVIDNGAFAALDRLADRDPDAYEKALAKLTPTQLDAYLASE